MRTQTAATAVLLMVAAASAAKITGITPSDGGIHGGTRLTVLGEGFDIRGRSNDVYIGSAADGIFCDPIPNECHGERIVCITDPAQTLRGKQPLSVKSFGFVAACAKSSGCTFTVEHDSTPRISSIRPEFIADPAEVTVSGSRFSQGDVTVGAFDFTMHVGDEERCTFGGGDAPRTASWSSFTCGLDAMPYPGEQPVTLQMGQEGNSENTNRVAIIPTVQGVAPSNGSAAGGQRLTVYGTAFGRDPTHLNVRVHGAPCQVVEVQGDYLVCMTTAHAATATRTPTYTAGKAVLDSWSGPGFSSVSDLATSLRYISPDRSAVVGSVGGSNWFDRRTGTAARFTALFVANETGNHTFQIAADDQAELWIGEDETPVARVVTAVTDADPTYARRVAVVASATSSYTSWPEQTGVVALEAGQKYWLQITVVNNGGGHSDLHVRATANGKTLFDDSMPASFIAMPDMWAPPVTVSALGIPAVVGRGCARRGECDFNFLDAKTPILQTVTPTALSGATSTITVTGTGFSATASSNIVAVSGVPCPVTTASTTQLVCTTETAVPAGKHYVRVRVVGFGRAINSIAVTSTPTVTGVTNTAASVVVTGTGFGMDASRVTVKLGAETCAITSLANERIECTAPAAVTTGSVTASVEVRQDEVAVADRAFVFDQALTRPGTTTAPGSPSLAPVAGSVAGGTILTILVPGWTMSKRALLSVAVGATPCKVILSFQSRVQCITAAVPAVGTHSVTVTYDGATKAVGMYLFREEINDVYPLNLGTRDGNLLRIGTESLPHNASEVSITFAGYPCELTQFRSDYLECIPDARRPATNPVLASFQHTDTAAMTNLQASPGVSQTASGFSIPAGEFLVTRAHFRRPISIRADVQAAEGGKYVRMQGLIDDPTSTQTGYTAFTGYRGWLSEEVPSTNFFGVQVDHWHARRNPENVGDLAGTSFTPGSFQQWRFDILDRIVRFYVNDALVAEYDHNSNKMGAVGFVGSSQDILVRNFVIQDLSGHRLQVNMSGRELFNRPGDHPYDLVGAEPSPVTGVQPTTLKGGSVMTVIGTGFSIGWWNYFSDFIISATATDKYTKDSVMLCSSEEHNSATIARCTVSNSVPAGTYVMRMRTRYGFAQQATTITVQAAVTAITPATISPAGGIITIAGSGFTGVNADTTVTVGGTACAVLDSGKTYIRCSVTGITGASNAVVITHKGAALAACAGCTIAVTAADAPQITYTLPSILDARWSLRMDGTNIGWGTITVGGEDCYIHSASSTRVYCRMPEAGFNGITGTKAIVYNVNGRGFANNTGSVTFTAGTYAVAPTVASAAGGASLTIFGQGFAVPQGTSVESSNFATGTTTRSWTIAPAMAVAPFSTCDSRIPRMLGGYGKLDFRHTVAKTVTSIPAHTHLSLNIRVAHIDGPWFNHERLLVWVDGVRYTQSLDRTMCYGKINDESSCGNQYDECIYDLPFVVPHTAAAASIKFGIESFAGRSFGVLSTRVGAVSSIDYAATVGGTACPISFMDTARVVCTTPTVTNAVHTVILSRSGSALPCGDACTVNTTAGAPVTAVLGFSPRRAIRGNLTAIDWTATNGVAITADATSSTLRKVVVDTWGTGHATSAQTFDKASGFMGIEFKADRGYRFMAGFRSAARIPARSSYEDLDFAFYNDVNDAEIYESSAYQGQMNTGLGIDSVIRVEIDHATDSVAYFVNGMRLFASERKVQWPVKIRVAIHTENATVANLRPLFTAPAPTAASDVALVLSGDNFLSDLWDRALTTVTVGGVACPVAEAERGHVTCLLPIASAPAMGAVVNVAVSNVQGTGAATAVTVRPIVSSASAASGSSNGGQELLIRGAGFVGTLTATVGSAACAVTASGHDWLKCTTSAMPTGIHTVAVAADGVASACLSAADPIVFADVYAAAVNTVCPTLAVNATTAAAITGVSASTVAEGTVLTITGTMFMASAPTDAMRPTVSFAAGGACTVNGNVTATQLVCTVAWTAGATTTVAIHFPGYGITNGFAVTTTLSVTSTEAHQVGQAGGAKVTLVGAGFGNSAAAVSLVDGGAVSRCASIALESSTRLVCTVAAGTFTQAAAADLQLRVGSASLNVGLIGGATPRLTAAAANAPAVTSVSPAAAAFGDVVTIAGTNLDGAYAAAVGADACAIMSASATTVVCRVSGSIAPAGAAVSVSTAARGMSGGSVTLLGALGIRGLNFARAAGGSSITIMGAGFSTTPADFKVKIGTMEATVTAADANNLTVTLPPTPTAFVGESLDVTVARVGSVVTASQVFTYTAGVTPTISNVVPTVASAAGGAELTITGAGFLATPSLNVVTVAGKACPIVGGTTTELRCTLPALAAADATAAVTVSAYGMASTSTPINMALAVTSASVASGSATSVSNEGGLVLTIAGTGFPLTMKGNTKIWVGGNECPVTATSATELQCELPPATRVRENTPALINAYPAKPEGQQNIVVKVNGTTATIDNATTHVGFVNSATPTITAVTMGAYLKHGDVITITGTGFAASGNVVQLRRVDLNPNASACTVTGESATQVVCTVAATTFGEHSVRVIVPGKGAARTVRSCPAGQFLMCDGTCLADADCTIAEWGIFGNCATLAQVILNDQYCHSNGGTDRVNIPMKLQNGKDFNMNCPMYSCEGNDCDTRLEIGGRGARVSTCRADPNGFVATIKPVISAVSSVKSSSTNGGLRITVTGTGFSDSSVVGLSGATCAVLSWTTTQIVCETTATAASTGRILGVWTDRVAAECLTTCTGFSFDAAATPTFTDIQPQTSSRADCGQSLTITGTGFSSTPANNVFAVGGVMGTVVSATATQLVVTCPPQVAGDYSGSVRVVGKGLATHTVPAFRYRPSVHAISANMTSLVGGRTITITGTGFKDVVAVAARNRCTFDVLSWTASTVVARTTACTETSGATLDVYNGDWTRSICYAAACGIVSNSALTPIITSLTQNGNTITIQGTFISAVEADMSVTIGASACTVVSFTGTQITCEAAAAHRAGVYPIVLNVAGYGNAYQAIPATKAYALTVASVLPASGSLGGGQSVTLTGTGFDANFTAVKIGGMPCTVSSASDTTLVCKTAPSATAGAMSVTLNATSGFANVNHTALTASAQYTYDAALTPTVTSISPYAGSTAGGTILTLTGTNLATTVTVSIAGVACAQDAGQQAATTATMYMCTTGKYKTDENPLIVAATPTNGNAVVTGTYQYVDLWSRWTTWGNTAPPSEGDSAVVSEGQTVVLDVSPPQLYLIIVMGHLKFETTKALTLEATYIMVNFGRFTIGTPDAPYTHKATIRLFGDRLTPEIPVHGSKVLAVRHGALDLHGVKRVPTWTTLSATAQEASSTIQLLGPVDWQVGETIVIASTDYKVEHAEERKIAAISGAATATVTVTLSEPLEHLHFGERQCFGTSNAVCVDEVAEVILLDRNIVIEGDNRTKSIGFGGTAFLMPLGQDNDKHVRLSYVEFRDVGQQYIVGRYPVHFHVTHSINNSYVNGTSVHHSLNRAFSIHGTNNNTYVNNVVYDTGGHAFFIEDGSERWNVIDNNVVIFARTSTSNLNTDVTPACFWIVSPSNKVTNNRAAGSQAYGIWISPFHPHSTGPTFSTSICPATHPLWMMENNTAHSNAKYGLNVFRFWWPKKAECDFDGEDEQAIIRNHLSFKNKIHGVTMAHSEVGEVGSVKMDNLTSADNGHDHQDAAAFWVEHIKAANMTYGVQNSVLIALTNNAPYRRSLRRRAINLPLGDNFFSENVTFVNYNNENFGFEPQAWAERMSFCFPWGWEAVAKGLRWIDSPNRILYRFHHHGVINDIDGTLTGTPRSQIAPKVPLYDPAQCPDATGFNTLIPAVVCNEHYKIRRWDVSTIDSVWKDQLWTIDGRTEAVPEIKHKYSVVAPINKNATIDFNYAFNPTLWTWKMTPRFFQPTERMVFRTIYRRPRYQINASFDGATLMPSATPISLDGDASAYLNMNGTFEALVKFPTTRIDVTAIDCPPEGCPVAPAAPPAVQKTCGSWADAASWTSGVVPATGANVNVTYMDSVCLDKPDGMYTFGTLYVQGTVTLRDSMCPASGVVTIRVTRFIHVNGGTLRLGNSTHPLTTCRVRIIFGAVDWNNQGPHILLPWGARAITVEAGQLSLVADTPALLSSRLTATAAAGATTLALEHDASSWRVGDEVVISSTARGDMFSKARESAERRTIASVSGMTVTLTAALTNAHFGAPKQTLNGTLYSVGATVALVNRLIEITSDHVGAMPPFEQGWALNVGCTQANTVGCGLPGQGAGMGSMKTADLRLAGARFVDLGQGRAFHSGIEIDGLVSSADGRSAGGSVIERCFFDSTWNNAIGIRHTTTNMTVRDNVFYYVRGDALRVIGANNRIENNVVVSAETSLMGCTDFVYKFVGDGTEDCRPAAYRIARGNNVIGNRVAGAIAAGFVTDGDECGSTNVWAMNEADSARDGVLVYDRPSEAKYNWPSPGYMCRWIRGVRVQNSQDNGVAAWYVTGDLKVTNMVLVDNMVGMMPLLLQATEDGGQAISTFTLRDSVVAGKWPVQSCRAQNIICRHTLLDSEPWCEAFHSYAPAMSNVGVLEAVFVFDAMGGRTKGEHKFMWMEPDHYATLKGRAIIDRVHFDQFDGSTACGKKSVAFYQNPFSNDTFHQHVFSNIAWGTSVVNGGEFYARTTYGDVPNHQTVGVQSTYLDFDNIKFGAYWPDAPNKVWLTDADGTFSRTGARAQILASQTVSRDNIDFQSLPWDGSGLRNLAALGAPRQGCTSNAGWNAFVCDNRFQMISLNIEHLGEDALTRRAAPVVLCKGDGMIGADGKPLCQGSTIDFASGPVMKGKIERATLDRLTRFRFVAEQGGNYTLYFRGQPPAWMRLRITNSEYLSLPVAAGITVNLRYFGLNAEARVGVSTNGVRQTSRVSRAYPWALSPPVAWPSSIDPSGTHYHNKFVTQGFAVNVMSVSLREGDFVDLKQEPIVVVNMDVSMPVDEFFNNKATFAAAMANVLGIDASRMKFVEIVAGSTRRQTASATTKLGIEIEQSSSSASAAASAGTLHSSNDLSSVNQKLGNLGGSVGTFQVSNVQTVLHTVDIATPAINIGQGNDYIVFNVTMSAGVTFSDTTVGTSVAAFTVSSYGTTATPHNATAATDVAIGNVFRDAGNFTRFTVSFAYEENLAASNAAVATLANSVATPARFLPAGYNVVGYTVVRAGATTTAAPGAVATTTMAAGPSVAPSSGPTSAPTVQVTLPVTISPNGTQPAAPVSDSGVFGSSSATTFIVAIVVGLVLVIGVTIAIAVYLLVIRPARLAAKTADMDDFHGAATPPTAGLAPKVTV